MPLLAPIYNDHVRQLAVTIIREHGAIKPLLRAAIAYSKLGADQREAAIRFVREVYQEAFGVDPTSSPSQRHRFKHWIDAVSPGEGVEA